MRAHGDVRRYSCSLYRWSAHIRKTTRPSLCEKLFLFYSRLRVLSFASAAAPRNQKASFAALRSLGAAVKPLYLSLRQARLKRRSRHYQGHDKTIKIGPSRKPRPRTIILHKRTYAHLQTIQMPEALKALNLEEETNLSCVVSSPQ